MKLGPGGGILIKFLQCTKLDNLLVKPNTYRTILKEKWQMANGKNRKFDDYARHLVGT